MLLFGVVLGGFFGCFVVVLFVFGGFVCLFFGWEAFCTFILECKFYFEVELWNSWVKIRCFYITNTQSVWRCYVLQVEVSTGALHRLTADEFAFKDRFFLAFSQRLILKDLNPACIRKGEALQHNYITAVVLVLPFWSHPLSCLFFLLELVSRLVSRRAGKDTSHNELSVSWISAATNRWGQSKRNQTTSSLLNTKQQTNQPPFTELSFTNVIVVETWLLRRGKLRHRKY